eukprot:CAMPEP_0118951898 /NCGR_PEP_ID=MMETSP1169-20130426/53898_1 /TAXON_ID=36882 /ORGANISM="Pyramimonas obovata, Strain CCMP722" /LENGTH=139 /DNA_ID=CAMNT_0006899041 /DNA_START=97 /DNA_END=513 /DNA_ORIENTATION=+
MGAAASLPAFCNGKYKSVLAAAEECDVRKLKVLLPAKPNLASKFMVNKCLALAARSGSVEAVQYLLTQGANLNYKDRHGRSAIMIASLKGHQSLVKFLLEAKASLACADDLEGFTSLHLAAMRGNNEILKMLLDAFPPD